MYGNDTSVISNPNEEYKTLVDAIEKIFEVFGRVMVELPLYKLYNNNVAKMHKEATMVRFMFLKLKRITLSAGN